MNHHHPRDTSVGAAPSLAVPFRAIVAPALYFWLSIRSLHSVRFGRLIEQVTAGDEQSLLTQSWNGTRSSDVPNRPDSASRSHRTLRSHLTRSSGRSLRSLHTVQKPQF
jgi:hypothetical protein